MPNQNWNIYSEPSVDNWEKDWEEMVNECKIIKIINKIKKSIRNLFFIDEKYFNT